MNTRSNWPLPVETSVVTRWRRMFSSTTTQFNLMSGLSTSNFGESFLSSIIAGLLTTAIVTVFCWARTLAPVSRTANRGNARCFIVLVFRGAVVLWRRRACDFYIVAYQKAICFDQSLSGHG